MAKVERRHEKEAEWVVRQWTRDNAKLFYEEGHELERWIAHALARAEAQELREGDECCPSDKA